MSVLGRELRSGALRRPANDPCTRHREGLEQFRVGVGNGGRLIPKEMATKLADETYGSVNRRVFEEVKHNFDRWSVYDNSVNGRPPILVDSSEGRITS